MKKDESVSELAEKMLEYEHCGFPVVNDQNQLIGSVTRRILAVVLEFHFDQDRENVRKNSIVFTNYLTQFNQLTEIWIIISSYESARYLPFVR